MNNEPVAWRCKKFYETQEGWFYNENEIGEPLYTHPVKELTERIRKLETALQGWEIGFEKMGYERLLKNKDEYIAELLKEPVKELTDGEIERIYFQTESVWDKDGNFQYLEFARAILRKAQEK